MFILVCLADICGKQISFREEFAFFGKTKMVDRKARSLTFKMPYNMTPRKLKEAIDGGIESNETVFKIWEMASS